MALQLGCRDEAIRAMERADRLADDRLFPVMDMLAGMHAITGRSERAVEIYEALLCGKATLAKGMGKIVLGNAVKGVMMLGVTHWLGRVCKLLADTTY